jgi:hypothetical protein
VRCRVEDGDATAEDWTDSNGKALAADRFWNSGIETMIAGDEEGPCLGIQLNIWERAKVISSCYALLKLCALYSLYNSSSLFSIARQVRRHIVHTLVGGGGQHGDSMPLITAKSGREMLASWGRMTFSLFCLTSLQGFCSNFTLIDLKASISPSYLQTEVILMCTEHFWMIRYMNMSYSEHLYVIL